MNLTHRERERENEDGKMKIGCLKGLKCILFLPTYLPSYIAMYVLKHFNKDHIARCAPT